MPLSRSGVSDLPAHFSIKTEPLADPKAVVISGNARFTILTSRLLRLEFSPDGRFEDRASQAVWFRHLPSPHFTVKQDDASCEISTEKLHLVWRNCDAGFTPESLHITLIDTNTVWKSGDADPLNLGGTIRTLDNVNGPVPLPPGLMSRSGWSVLDDSSSLVFDDRCWLVKRSGHAESKDLYFFGYGSDYQGCMRDFCAIAGTIPLVPRWVLGNWWSRYWEYTEEELQTLIGDFRTNEIPLSVCIIDMDWHVVKNPYSGGWTGYTWNREFFPDPTRFISWLHDQGLRTALNLHPADGVHPHEEVYEEFARRMGIDPGTKSQIPFDIADPRFTTQYFELLHHPHEKIGIDFWWMDWQQGLKTKVDGLDPLWWLNHLHYLDLARDGVQRPVIFSRWGEWGNHRYPIGFSGDTHVTWETLDFQPYFTATASNVGYCYWSHDIGGHFQGMEDPELFLRWIQFGVFSPVLRIHSCKERFQDRRPWMMGEGYLSIVRRFMQLRHALIPYIYTACRETATDCVPLVRPMYWEHPEAPEAYCCPNQYYFGSRLLVAPFTSPRDPDTQLSRRSVWLPEGGWYHFFTGEYYAGGSFVSCYGGLDDIPLFAPAGAIVPRGPMLPWGNTGNPGELILHVFAGADGRYDLYEDDGTTMACNKGSCCTTAIEQNWTEEKLSVTVHPASGDTALLPQVRSWSLEIAGIRNPDAVCCTVDGEVREIQMRYDASREILTISGIRASVTQSIRLTLTATQGGLASRRSRKLDVCDSMLQRFRLPTIRKGVAYSHLQAILENPVNLASLGFLKPSQLRAISETVLGAGADVVREKGVELFIAWNRGKSELVRYNFHSNWGSYRNSGTVPAFFRAGRIHAGRGDDHQLRPGEGYFASINIGGLTIPFNTSEQPH